MKRHLKTILKMIVALVIYLILDVVMRLIERIPNPTVQLTAFVALLIAAAVYAYWAIYRGTAA